MKPPNPQWGAKGSAGPSGPNPEALTSFVTSGGSIEAHAVGPDAAPGQTIPERALCAAILERAIEDLRIYKEIDDYAEPMRPRIKQSAAGANAWIFDDAPGPFTFQQICAAIGFDPEAIRDALSRRQLRISKQQVMQ